ncbi:SET domain-containing protein-lysine N-methyltransferase [Candidatus Kaiserbacteria bacterium]|nr:SET domain-containing protein-lysine N-methyltransferase [Candidatus Kaiserbacteria bacterium]
MERPADVRVGRSSAGLGLFTKEDLVKDDFIIEYIGEHISHEESDRRGGKYLFTLNDDIIVDGKDRKNKARYINHSCRPNCDAEIEDEERILIRARKRIKAGEELTIDYGKEYFAEHIAPYGCRCAKCSEK